MSSARPSSSCPARVNRRDLLIVDFGKGFSDSNTMPIHLRPRHINTQVVEVLARVTDMALAERLAAGGSSGRTAVGVSCRNPQPDQRGDVLAVYSRLTSSTAAFAVAHGPLFHGEQGAPLGSLCRPPRWARGCAPRPSPTATPAPPAAPLRVVALGMRLLGHRSSPTLLVSITQPDGNEFVARAAPASR